MNATIQGPEVEQTKDDTAWMVKAGERHHLICCDCGLVHDLAVVPGEGDEAGMVGIALRRNLAATVERRAATATAWAPIAEAPQDGRPVWVRGRPWGNPSLPWFACWAWWDGAHWRETGSVSSHLGHLVEWMP